VAGIVGKRLTYGGACGRIERRNNYDCWASSQSNGFGAVENLSLLPMLPCKGFKDLFGRRSLTNHDFHRYVADVLRTPKVITDSIDWTDKPHPDFVACKLPVYAPEMPHFRLRLDLQTHVRRMPMKSSFTLLFTQRIFGLDVNPGMTHTNLADGRRVVIRGTHWTQWPCDIAELDQRSLEHQQWLNHFLLRANISFLGRYEHPPYLPEQMSFGYD
jgi:hypothetical protein